MDGPAGLEDAQEATVDVSARLREMF
jgi:hypothetical protein